MAISRRALLLSGSTALAPLARGPVPSGLGAAGVAAARNPRFPGDPAGHFRLAGPRLAAFRRNLRRPRSVLLA